MSQEEEPVYDNSGDLVPVSSGETDSRSEQEYRQETENLGRELLDLKLDTLSERENYQKEMGRLRRRVNNLTLLLLVVLSAAAAGGVWLWQAWQQEKAQLQEQIENNLSQGEFAQLQTEMDQTNQQVEDLQAQLERLSQQPSSEQQQAIAANSEQVQALQSEVNQVKNRLDQRQEAIAYMIRALENLVGESEFPDTSPTTSESKAGINDDTEPGEPQASPSPSPSPSPRPSPTPETNAPSGTPNNNNES
ncbi:hypothetical protein [Geitlerinema sp. PCC 9228]|uniref:hypothetical protein n=1 Tax=Geitlerinema sp. PCC 9228 TaxID=111611 RepID=UPI0008F9B897|nr:hypothetical protein [Geitlerinema sp. PCC 9228]